MRYLDVLQAQLVTASRELSDAPGGSIRHRRTRLRAVVRRHTYISTGLALVTVAAASGAIADASGLLGPPDLSAPSPLGTPSSIPSDLAASFSILRRAADPADTLPAGTSVTAVAGGVSTHYGINVGLSRFVGTLDGTSIWLVVGSTGACMYTATQGGSCGPTALVTTQGLVLALVPVGGGAATFIGVLPDGASVTATNTDGSNGPVARSGSAYSVSGDTNLRSVTIRDANGQTFTLPAPGLSAATSPAPADAPPQHQ
jgi:hypothetical protein